MKIQKLIPAIKDYLWGGNKLKSYGIESDKDRIAEAWLLSCHKDGPCRIRDGTNLSDNLTLKDLGANNEKFEFFPVLIKLIDAKQNLSIQVHPSDSYALLNERHYGKTEMWYVVDCEEGASVYLGLKNEITKTQFKKSIENNEILDILNSIKVKKGDCYFIPAGTIHAIGKGCVICEIQQSSNLTYRIYDYGRVDANGCRRELHIDKAVEAASLKPYISTNFENGILGSCEYFTARINNTKKENSKLFCRTESFTSIVVLDGSGQINKEKIKKGDCYFIPAGEKAEIEGDVKFIEVYV